MGQLTAGASFLDFVFCVHMCVCVHTGGGRATALCACERVCMEAKGQTNVGAILMKASTSFEAGSYWSGARQLD